ncbi:MAG: cation-efflux pump [bacterium]
MKGSEQTVIKQRVALSSVVASLFLVIAKFAVGIITGSLGIISEAIHSTLDLGAALLTYFAVKVSDKPADRKYNYGYGKYESLSALIETGLLVITSFWIIYKAFERLFITHVKIEVTAMSFGVMILAIIVDASRATILSRTAKKYNSQALEADALHFSSDILSSSVVIIGLISAKMGFVDGDSIAAAFVAIVVLVASYRLGRKTINVLLDRAPEGLAEQIRTSVMKISGVTGVHNIRIRHSNARLFIDMHVNVEESLPFVEVHDVTEKIEKDLASLGYDADVVVHAEPDQETETDISTKVLSKSVSRETIAGILKSHSMKFHDLTIRHSSRRCFIDFHLELPSDISVEQAHNICDMLEADIKRLVPHSVVNIHVEPMRK